MFLRILSRVRQPSVTGLIEAAVERAAGVVVEGIADGAVWGAMFGVWAFVGACTVVGFAVPAVRKSKSTPSAITSWWPVTLTAALGCLCGKAATVVVFSVVGVLVLRELVGLLGLSSSEARHHV